MMSIENRVGRLCEARFAAPFPPTEIMPYVAAVARVIAQLGRPSVFCCDARRVLAFPPEVSDRLTALMKSDNPLVEKNGMLHDGSVFGMQIERMFREAGNPGRRAFTKSADLELWLGASLTAAEQRRLAAFIGEGSATL